VHQIQQKLLELSKRANLAKMSLRDMAAGIGLPGESPQRIKHHLLQLEKRGFLTIDRGAGVMSRTPTKPSWAKGQLEKAAGLFSIPILGSANCGVATIFAEQNFQGFLRVSGRLVGRSRPTGLYAIKTDGASMNQAEIGGRRIEDGDYVVIDSNDKNAKTKDVVLAIVDDKATIKRFIDDRANGQVVLKADSSFRYDPIHLHPEDDFQIGGKVIAVIKRPR
jgi:SOS-response transcriptional repressor LexA